MSVSEITIKPRGTINYVVFVKFGNHHGLFPGDIISYRFCHNALTSNTRMGLFIDNKSLGINLMKLLGGDRKKRAMRVWAIWGNFGVSGCNKILSLIRRWYWIKNLLNHFVVMLSFYTVYYGQNGERRKYLSMAINCGLFNFEIVKQKRMALRSMFTLTCDLCGYIGTISTQQEKNVDPSFFIEKIECRNHALRNYCFKIWDLGLP